MLTIDFETEAIEGNPIYRPPTPVGVSIKRTGHASKYCAWGHPSENNCALEGARYELLSALEESGGEYLAHNAPFEASILEKYFGIKSPEPTRVQDTQYLLFLADPYATTFSLKPSAERVLGIAPDEQQELKDWVLANVPGSKNSDWGAYISKAPGSLVGKYACGDTDRTLALYEYLLPRIESAGMLEAYRREQKLMPILYDSSKRGVRVDTGRLETDIEVYTRAMALAEKYIRQALGDFNIDSDRELAEALDKAGQVTEWVLTPTGRRSTARKNLSGRVKDPQLMAVLAYRGILATCLGTFAGPWLLQAMKEGGRVHPQWNQVRGDRGSDGDISGTRTGRMSCKGPNLQNVSTEFEGVIVPDFVETYFADLRSRGWVGPSIPHMRQYLLPEKGHVWCKRDFAAQEMRIMAHYAEGRLFEAFKENPRTDPHAAVQKIIKDILGIDLPRKVVKITGFGIMYGRGVPNLSSALGVSQEEGKQFRDAYYSALPEIKELSASTRNRGRRGLYIRTWGGRVYYREPNPERDLSYKLLNYLIQGSAADQTKEATIDYDAARDPDELLLADVHDEMNASVPEDKVVGGMRRLKDAMDAPRFDVPFMSEGFTGPNWSDIKEYAE